MKRRTRHLEGKSWSERNELAEAEYQAMREARKNEPKMRLRMKIGFKFDSMFGWFSRLFHKGRLPGMAFCALCLASCATANAPLPNPNVDAAKAQIYQAIAEVMVNEIKGANQ